MMYTKLILLAAGVILVTHAQDTTSLKCFCNAPEAQFTTKKSHTELLFIKLTLYQSYHQFKSANFVFASMIQKQESQSRIAIPAYQAVIWSLSAHQTRAIRAMICT